MLCRNCYREIPDGTKFCPECGASTEASVNASLGNAEKDVGFTEEQIQYVKENVNKKLNEGSLERHTLGDGSDWEASEQGLYEQGASMQGQPAQGQYQQPQYQQGQFQQGGFQQGQYQQGQYQQRQIPPNQGYYNQTTPPVKSKQSGMSTAAMILGILTCTAILGFIIGLIDLIKNKDDGNKHGGSIFAVIWGGIILLATFSNAVRLGYDRAHSNTASSAVESSQDNSDYSNDGYDQPAASDDSQRSNDSYSDSQTDDSSSQEQSSSDSGVVDPQLKAALDSYEEFIDEYVKFLKTYTQTSDPMAMLSEYTQYMTKYSELVQKMSELDKMQDQMSSADLAYYIDWNARMQKKILEISNFTN